MPHPNIILILTDQLRTDALGCYGGKVVPTPHINRLAAGGVVYSNCYTDCPVCTPARSSLWTGKSVIGHGVYALHDILPDSERLFTEQLQETGYRTALFGKLHVSARLVDANELHPHSGFDVYENALSPYNHDCVHHAYRDWLQARNPALQERLAGEGSSFGHIPEEFHFSSWVAERAEDFITQQSGRQPFFCCASFVDPHDPFDDHPEEFLREVDKGELDRFDEQRVHFDPPGGVRREQQGGVLGCAADYTQQQLRRMRRSYYASVALLDKCVGRIVRALESAGIYERTVILFTTDHGEMLGQRGLLGKGAYFYEPCARLPLIAHGPGFQDEESPCARPVQLRDLAATILTTAGCDRETIETAMPRAVALQDPVERNFTVTLYRNSCINRDKVFWDPPILCSMIRHGTHKLTLYHSTLDMENIEGELFDLDTDPGEARNLWEDPASQGRKFELTAMLLNWLAVEDWVCNGQGRGGQCFPPVRNWLKNNPIRSE